MSWKEFFEKGKELVLATCSKDCNPNANIVISLGFVDGKLLIADSQMQTTLKNLQEIKKICVVAGYHRLKGNVKIFNDGKFYDLCNKFDKKYPTKNAIVISIEEVFDLDKGKKVF